MSSRGTLEPIVMDAQPIRSLCSVAWIDSHAYLSVQGKFKAWEASSHMNHVLSTQLCRFIYT